MGRPNTSNSSSGSNANVNANANANANPGAISEIPMTGRELAIEALIDLDPRGPIYRINRILNEDTNAAIQARPNKITKSALLDAALMLSKYQYKSCKDYLQQQQQFNNSNNTNTNTNNSIKQPTNESSTNEENSESIHVNRNQTEQTETNAIELFKEDKTNQVQTSNKKKSLSQNERERVMKHLAKIILTKSKDITATASVQQEDVKVQETSKTTSSTSTGITKQGGDNDDNNDVEESSIEDVSVSAYPPPQLVIALRRIYGSSSSSDHLDELDDSDGGKSTASGSTASSSNLLPSLIQSIVEHSVFSNRFPTTTCSTSATTTEKDNEDENEFSGERSATKRAKTDSSSTIDPNREVDDNNDHPLQLPRKNSFNNNSPIANLEALIGNACNLVAESTTRTSDNDDNDEIIVGILIAALSVLTSCITTTSTDDDVETSSMTSITSDNKDHQVALQVGGPLSFHVDMLSSSSIVKDDRVLNSEVFSDLLLHPILMNYFIDAASVHEEREEKKKEEKEPVSKVGVDKTEKDELAKKDIEKSVDNDAQMTEEENSDGLNVNATETNEEDMPAEPEHEDAQEFQEPHGYSFIEEEDDDDDDEDDEDNSSQEDDQSSVSTSSGDDQGDDELEENANNTDDEQRSAGNKNESADPEGGVTDANREETSDSEEMKAYQNEASNSDEETLLLQAIALSYGDQAQSLPKLPAYPEEKYQPEDPAVLNPASMRQYGTLSAPAAFSNLLRLALVQLNHQEKRSDTCTLTIHLVMSILHLLSTSRAETIKLLSDLSIKLNQLNGKGRKIAEEISEDEDPAFGTATTHATSALEEKGMMRKAAAAAHSVSIQQEKLQQDVKKLKESLKFYSLGSYLAIKCLRTLLQQITLSPMHKESYKLSMITRVRLTACLSSYMSSSLSNQINTLSSHFKDMGQICQPRTLLFEAASLWGECTPLIFPTASDLESQLKRSLRQCFPSCFDENSENVELKPPKDIGLPWSETDANLLKLNSTCQRMRCQELLDYFIAAPKAYNNCTSVFVQQKSCISVHTMLSKVCLNNCNHYDPSTTENVFGLFFAFHARCTQDLLLWRNVETSSFHSSFSESIESKESIDGESKIIAVKNQTFCFDSSKCAESIALISSGSSNVSLTAHQRASKVWGTVFSTTSFEPKSGVHRWAVRLDKCERGHVFVGIVTSRASKKTYVGGDKYGWGVIGTQALWHERRKVRSDYGNTFRTGATVIVTLDTDTGTLRFGILHDSEHTSPMRNTSSYDLDRSRLYEGGVDDTSGYIEDWGIAFEGLPLDTKLFPAVGLYQRDDKVTLLNVSTESDNECDTPLLNDSVRGSLYYPEMNKLKLDDEEGQRDVIECVRKWNSCICNDGITFASHILNVAIDRLECNNISIIKDDFFQSIFPSVISSLALYPMSIPVLSGRLSITLLPLICRCLHLFEEKIDSHSRCLNPVERIKAGKWTIRAAPCTSSLCASDDIEEYVVDLQYSEDRACFRGTGVGTSGKSMNCKVTIVGAANGSLIQFAEEWIDEDDKLSEAKLSTSSCVAEAALNVFGTRFEGHYTNVHFGKSGSISGNLDCSFGSASKPFGELQQCLVSCSTLLGTAINHLSSTLSSGAPKSDVGPKMNQDFKVTKDHLEELQHFVNSSPILSNGLAIHSIDDTEAHSCTQSVLSHFLISGDKAKSSNVFNYWKDMSLPFYSQSKEVHDLFNDNIYNKIDEIDRLLAPRCGGYGSLSILEPEVYKKSRQNIIAVLVHHAGRRKTLSLDKKTNSDLTALWHTALQIIETGVRSTLFHQQDGSSRKKGCTRYCKLADSVSNFLITIIPQSNSIEVTMKSIAAIYAFASRPKDVLCFAEIMESRKRRDLLKFFGLSIIQTCIRGNVQTFSTMESLISSWQQSNREFDHFSSSQEKTSSVHSKYVTSMDKLHQKKFDVLSSVSADAAKYLSSQRDQNALTITSLQSLSITILPSLFASTKSNIANFPGGNIWKLIQSLIKESRKLIDGRDTDVKILNEAEIISNSMQRFTSLHIMNSITSVLHLFLYLLHNSDSISNLDDLTKIAAIPMKIVYSELKKVLELMNLEYTSNVGHQKLRKAGDDCDVWIMAHAKNTNFCVERVDECKQVYKNLSAGINFIVMKETDRTNKIGSNGKSADAIVTRTTFLSERYLIRLLNILSSLVHSKVFPYLIQNDEKWIDLLTKFICEEGLNSFPFRLRMRVIRLLRLIAPNIKPNVAWIQKLFTRIGTIAFSFDSTESPEIQYLEAKEIVSLLRTLHNKKFSKGTLQWSDCIYKAIELGTTSDSSAMTRGFHAYLGGIPEKVAISSCVLLKPSAASNITAASSQASYKLSDSKSKSMFESMAPIAASSGAEGIIAGLCRRDAMAGRISDIDVKSGVCEIVLFDRHEGPPVESSQTTGSISIRAVKVPCQEIVPADEIALLMDEKLFDIEKISKSIIIGLDDIEAAINLINANDADMEQFSGLEFEKLTNAILSTRVSAIVLSNPFFLKKFLQDNDVKEKRCMSKLLGIASLKQRKDEMSHSNSACDDSLGTLSEYHSRFWYLRGLIAEVNERKKAFNSVPFEKLCKTSKIIVSEDNLETPNKDNSDKDNLIMPQVARDDNKGTSEGTDNMSQRHEIGGDRTGFQSNSAESANDEEENNAEDSNSSRLADETEAAHLREAAIVQMAELGLPRSWSEYALRRVGGTNIEAAVHFCLERGGDMERLLLEEEERNQRSNTSSGRRQNVTGESGSSHLLRQLVEMGFPPNWCAEALSSTGHNVDEALTWMIRNGERLSALDEGVDNIDDNDADDDDDGDSDEDDENTKSQEESYQIEKRKENKKQIWRSDVVCPLRSISGRTNIDQKTLEISGLPSGGFSSVGMKGICLESGKWYYEAELITDGCLQIGWADSSFSGHCQAERGDGCGDGPSSWAFDGWRRYRWHSTATEWGCRWTKGDIVGCLLDMDKKEIRFTLNGRGEDIGMGLAFSGDGFRPCGGVYACVSFNRKEKIRLILGDDGTDSFNFMPPPGYKGVGEAVHSLVKEREVLIKNEEIFNDTLNEEKVGRKSYMCDFSDGEHGYELFAWQHRYYGSDASVHLGGQGKHRNSSKRRSLGASLKVAAKTIEEVYRGIIDTRLSKEWSNKVAEGDLNDHKLIVNHINSGYDAIIEETQKELSDVCLAVCILYARKLIMHVMITLSSDFDLSLFHPQQENCCNGIAKNLFIVIERCCGLHAAGWVGEAGAMAVASEALGLAISSHERNGNSFSSFLGMSNYKIGRNSGDGVCLPTAALSQFLSTAKFALKTNHEDMFDPSLCLSSCSEAALGGEIGGSIIFIRNALQNATICSTAMVDVLLARIRQSVRLLSSVEYGETSQNYGDSDNEDDDDEDYDDSEGAETRSHPCNDATCSPDARLILFLTGLLLSKPVTSALDALEAESHSSQSVADSLFLTWSVGLLSASAPWRMVCAMTVSSILNLYPQSFCTIPSSLSTIKQYYSRLFATVSRRMWAERSAVPICSRYVQSFVDLSCSIRNATMFLTSQGTSVGTFGRWVDAATPISISPPEWSDQNSITNNTSWECDEGWINSDAGWEVWTGELEYHPVDWMTPSRSAVRSLTDGGEGPPMLREGCSVIRGLDWNEDGSGANGNEDGKDLYDKEKERISEINKGQVETTEAEPSPKKKHISPKLPVGTVLSIEPWKGIPGVARRVRWHLTNEEGIYRFGGDGGRYDIVHVDVNEKSTRIRKRHPLPESLEQCSARYGFGLRQKFSIILRLQRSNQTTKEEMKDEETRRVGILEMPDFGAGILVDCDFYEDGAIAITERRLLYGSKDSGWQPRFGQPSYVPGTTIILTGTKSPDNLSENAQHELLLGSDSHTVQSLRNRANGEEIRVTSEMRLFRDKSLPCFPNKSLKYDVSSSQLPPIRFDGDFHANSMKLSHDQRTITCTASDGRCTAFGSVGFAKGIHYWEVKIEQADTGSIFIGVAEKPTMDTSSTTHNQDYKSRLNRWLGCGFVNFRATYSAGSERVYGAHCHAGDTIGVLLDCDCGRLSFFFDGVKYGEHIMNDLGCAYENISPFGFNADGCGSSGAGQGAPNGNPDRGHSRGGSRYPSNGAVQPKALWPVIGMRHAGDRVTFSSKWMTSHGVNPSNILKNALKVDEIFSYYESISKKSQQQPDATLPTNFLTEAYCEYNRWKEGRWQRSTTRGSGGQNLSSCGLEIDIDTNPLACAMACASIGLRYVLLPGDQVKVKRSSGRLLELPEEAKILGAYQGRLWYQIISQKSEGGSLSEGGGRAWFWDESEVVDDSLQIIGENKAHNIDLPLLDRFKCSSEEGLKVIYSEGAVVRLDLEIFEGSETIGTIPQGTVIPYEDVLERRMNSCGVIRFRVRVEDIGEGWISSRIRGGTEEAIVEQHLSTAREQNENKNRAKFTSARECAEVWRSNCGNTMFQKLCSQEKGIWSFSGLDEFTSCLRQGLINGMSAYESDSFLTSFIGAVSNCSSHGNGVEVSYDHITSILYTSMKSHDLLSIADINRDVGSYCNADIDSSIASMFARMTSGFPSIKCLIARIAMLKALNRRVKYALPWLLSRSPQESSAVLGGLSGFGASIERCGKSQQNDLERLWVQASSAGGRIRDYRSILFDSVKREYIQRIMDATTTPTPLSHDEYELPREVRTVRVNRVKARNAMASNDNISKKKHSVFSQLQNETRGWSGAALRRGHVAKGHGGQKRAFKVKLIGEGVNDYSGPYREVFADAIREVISVDSSTSSSLGVLEPSPNQVSDIGEDRNLFMFSCPCDDNEPSGLRSDLNVSDEERLIRKHYSSYIIGETEEFRESEESISFLGKLASTAVRHGILVDLPLSMRSVWGPLCEEKYDELESLKELDLLSSRYVDESKNASNLLVKQKRMLNAFAEGVSSVMPIEVFSIFSAKQLMDFYCGNSDIDVDLLQKIVEYEGYKKDDLIIKYFWEVLREMTSEERKLFLQFVWARTRLPLKESDFEDPFKIMKDTKSARRGESHTALPSASTCFFSLSLPQYTDKETLRQKLLFAINNVTTMESDYVTNDSEVREGWRGM